MAYGTSPAAGKPTFDPTAYGPLSNAPALNKSAAQAFSPSGQVLMAKQNDAFVRGSARQGIYLGEAVAAVEKDFLSQVPAIRAFIDAEKKNLSPDDLRAFEEEGKVPDSIIAVIKSKFPHLVIGEGGKPSDEMARDLINVASRLDFPEVQRRYEHWLWVEKRAAQRDDDINKYWASVLEGLRASLMLSKTNQA